MQKLRIIGFFFSNSQHWHSEVEKKILQKAVVGYIFICLQIKYLIHNSLYVFNSWGERGI